MAEGRCRQIGGEDEVIDCSLKSINRRYVIWCADDHRGITSAYYIVSNGFMFIPYGMMLIRVDALKFSNTYYNILIYKYITNLELPH
jgi:hypothetical protein